MKKSFIFLDFEIENCLPLDFCRIFFNSSEKFSERCSRVNLSDSSASLIAFSLINIKIIN